MLKVKKKQELSSSKRNMSLMKKFDVFLCCKLCGEEIYKLKETMEFKTCNQDLTKVFNEHYRKANKCCQRLLKDESYVYKMKWARKEFIRKTQIKAFFEAEKEMIVRYMTVLTQVFVTMKDILLFYNFSDKDGPRIENMVVKKGTTDTPSVYIEKIWSSRRNVC